MPPRRTTLTYSSEDAAVDQHVVFVYYCKYRCGLWLACFSKLELERASVCWTYVVVRAGRRHSCKQQH